MLLTMIMKKRGIGVSFIFVLLLIILSSSIVFAQEEEQNLTSRELAEICIEDSKQISKDLEEDGFNVERIDDAVIQAEALYSDTIKKQQRDFSLILKSCEELVVVKELAYNSRDDYQVLLRFYNETITEMMDSAELDAGIKQIAQEIENERYEKVKGLIEDAYDEITSLRSEYATLNVFRRNTANFIIRFVKRNWLIKLIILFILIILYFMYRNRIMSAIIKAKMDRLDVRRKTLKNLIRETQKDYFEKGSLHEGGYNIRTKKFAELIRDVDRQIPLLKEQLAKLGKAKANADKSMIGFNKDDKKIEKQKNKK
jgi:hypothetical protein